jgi:hypothetical protein
MTDDGLAMDDGLQTGTRKRAIEDKAGDKAADNEMHGISCREIILSQ